MAAGLGFGGGLGAAAAVMCGALGLGAGQDGGVKESGGGGGVDGSRRTRRDGAGIGDFFGRFGPNFPKVPACFFVECLFAESSTLQTINKVFKINLLIPIFY